MKSNFSLQELAEKIGGKIDGDGSIEISSAAPIQTAVSGQISFISNEKYIKFLNETNASAVVLDFEVEKPENVSVLRHKNPYLAFALILDILYPETVEMNDGIDQSAVIDKTAEIDSKASIGPLCHIKRAKIGQGSKLVSSVFVGNNVEIGENCIIYPGVRIMDGCKIGNNTIIHSSTVIGSDGFGFAESETGLKKIKQVGWVEIGNNVEIGSNCSIDRGALGPTKIGDGSKIDNLVQIAHNVELGRHCIIVSQVGISGSTKLGNGVILAGQVGLVGHIELGDGVKVGAQSGVTKDVEPGKTVFGSPARDIMVTKRIEASMSRLPEVLKRLRTIEKKLDPDKK